MVWQFCLKFQLRLSVLRHNAYAINRLFPQHVRPTIHGVRSTDSGALSCQVAFPIYRFSMTRTEPCSYSASWSFAHITHRSISIARLTVLRTYILWRARDVDGLGVFNDVILAVNSEFIGTLQCLWELYHLKVVSEMGTLMLLRFFCIARIAVNDVVGDLFSECVLSSG